MNVEAAEPLIPSRQELDAEYAGLREDLRHMGGRVDAARTFGVAAVGAILTLAIQQRLAIVAIGAAALTHCFALLDLTNSHRFAAFARRARKIELALDSYDEYGRLQDEEAREQLQRSLDALGKRPFQAVLNEPGRHEMPFTYPGAVFRVLYPALLAVGGLLAIVLQYKKGSPWSTGVVAALVLALWLVCLPSYFDPKQPPLRWWLVERGATLKRRAWRMLPSTLAAGASVAAIVVLWPVFRGPSTQDPGTLAVALTPAARAVAVRLEVQPACVGARGVLFISWQGQGRALTVSLPPNLRVVGAAREAAVTVPLQGHLERLPLSGSASGELLGRCTFALPALVGAGQAQSGQASFRLSPAVGLAGQEAIGYSQAAVAAGACSATASFAPARTCAAVLKLEAGDTGELRVERVSIAAALLLVAFVLIAARLLAGGARVRTATRRRGSAL